MTSSAKKKLRRIFKSSMTGTAVIREMMQLMFLAELLQPSEDIWIVSPWVSDVVVLDNRAGSFDVVNPEWHRREIRLSDLSVQLLTGGSHLTVVTRPDEHNFTFLDMLSEKTHETSLEKQLTIIKRDTLHTKGVLTGVGLLLGSMNLTYSGFELNDEVIEYDTDPGRISTARRSFSEYLNEEAHD